MNHKVTQRLRDGDPRRFLKPTPLTIRIYFKEDEFPVVLHQIDRTEKQA